jgi:hypothetical protein
MNPESLLVAGSVLAAILSLIAFASGALAAMRIPRRSCPRCRYDLAASGPLPIVCPECGTTVARLGQTARPLVTRRATIAGIVLLAIGIGLLSARFREPLLRAILPAWIELDAVSQGSWQVRLLERRDPSTSPPEMPRRIEARFDGRVVLVFEGFHLRAGAATWAPLGAVDGGSSGSWPPASRSPDLGSPDRLPPAGSPGMLGDGDGDGRPDLAIEDPSGGSGGFTTTYLFTLESTGTVVPSAILENAFVVRRDDDSAFESIGFDPQYSYRWTSGAGSPRPRIVLAPDGAVPRSNWNCDADAMRLDPPTESQWQALLEAVRLGEQRAREQTEPGGDPSREPWLAPLLGTFCDLAYAGHVDLAWRFLDEAWPDGDISVGNGGEPRAKDAFTAELAEALSQSRCAEALGFPGGPPAR